MEAGQYNTILREGKRDMAIQIIRLLDNHWHTAFNKLKDTTDHRYYHGQTELLTQLLAELETIREAL